ncbi:MAG: hypothetical protein IH571_00145, partial [Acholeplasmataceae bacterium]|nr:hypothetical protein [Acholeplasmataceae bacterium]
MGYLNFKSLYDKNPLTNIHYCSSSVFEGEQEIIKKLKAITCGVLCFETYPGVDLEVLLNSIIRPLNPSKVINIENHSKNEKE